MTAHPDSPGGTVQLRRKGRLQSAAVALTVWIDDVQVAHLHNGGQVSVPVPPGAHHVQLRWKPGLLIIPSLARNSEVLRFHVEPHQVVRFDSQTGGSGIHLRRLEDPPVPAPSGSGATDAQVLGMTDTARIEEQIGADVRLIDNRASPAPVTRSLKASREWARTLTLDESRTQTMRGDVSANLLWLSAKGGIEAGLQRTLSLAIGSTHLFEEEISVTVPERTAVNIVLDWKRIWQCGEARVLFPEGSVHIVPYQVVVSVTFDQKIQEVTSLPDR